MGVNPIQVHYLTHWSPVRGDAVLHHRIGGIGDQRSIVYRYTVWAKPFTLLVQD